MLYLIGLGLGNEKDLTLNAIGTLKKCEYIYLENYTSNIGFEIKDLEKLIDNTVILADRNMIENNSDIILDNSIDSDVAVLIKGDVFGATTHVSLFLSAKGRKIEVKVMHNSSIITAIGDIGLMLYKFGKIISIPYHYKGTYTIFENYSINKSAKLHTLFLLDLNPKNNEYMNFKEGLNAIEENGNGNINLGTYAIICAGLGSDNALIKYGKIEDLLKLEINIYPQCIIIPGELHFMEEEMLKLFKI